MSRPIHKALATPGVVRITYHSQAHENYKKLLRCIACLRCDLCMCRNIDLIWESTYVTAYENKIEFNYPGFYCCCLVDQVGVIYYDRDIMKKTDKAGCCSPACTHMSFCPTCFDICGEGLVLYGATCCSTNLAALPGCAGVCCCRSYTIVTNLDGTEQLAKAINDGREACKQRMQAPGIAGPQ